MRDEPSPHLYVENVFTPATYAEILRLLPTGTALKPWDATGVFGNYARRRELSIVHEPGRLTPDQRGFWLEAAALLRGQQFFGALLERFEPYARERFGDRINDPSFLRDDLRSTLIVNEHEPDYYLGPHTDRRERVFTCLFYFPEDANLDHLGTTIYRPRDAAYTSDGTNHHDFALFEARETIPYRPNSMLVLARSDVLFHGVHALTAHELRGSRRRGMQVTFFVHNERPRESCKTTLRVTFPAELAAQSEVTVPIRLTNRAHSELASSLPYRTRLGYRWLHDVREPALESSALAPLPQTLRAGETCEASLRVAAPSAPGRYILRISVVQEGVAWFDDIDPENGAEQRVVVSPVSV